jgi:hypothetical protein
LGAGVERDLGLVFTVRSVRSWLRFVELRAHALPCRREHEIADTPDEPLERGVFGVAG